MPCITCHGGVPADLQHSGRALAFLACCLPLDVGPIMRAPFYVGPTTTMAP